MKNNNATRKYLGPKETEVISRLSYEKLSIVTTEQFDKMFAFNVGLRKQIFFRLKRKGILKSITKGIYYYSPLEAGPSGSRINEYRIPPLLFPKGNYYVGYSTMYNYYGFTDQLFQTVYVLNTSYQSEREISGVPFKFVKILPERVFGLVKIKIRDSEVIVSDKERTLLDLLYFPEPIGGLKAAFDVVRAQAGKIEASKLAGYACRFSSLSLQKRIGYALESAGVSGAVLKPLLRNVKKTSLSTLYGGKSRRGAINDKWRVIINAAR